MGLKLLAELSLFQDETGHLIVKDRDGQLVDVQEFEFWLNEFRENSLPLESINTHESTLLAKYRRVFTRPTDPGYVYLIGVNDQVFKIGQTGHLKSRVASIRREIQRTKKLDTELLHVIEAQDRYQAEAMLHNAYRGKRFHGEWFSLTPQDVDEIKAIAQIGGVL